MPAVRRKLRAVVQALGCGQARLLAAGRRDAVNVKLTVTLATENQRLALGRPPVPVGRTQGRDELGGAATDRQRVDERLPPSLRLVADGQQHAIRRDAVIVVTAGGEAGVDRLRFAAGDGAAVEAATAVEEQRATVAQPVGGLDTAGR